MVVVGGEVGKVAGSTAANHTKEQNTDCHTMTEFNVQHVLLTQNGMSSPQAEHEVPAAYGWLPKKLPLKKDIENERVGDNHD